MRGLQELQLVEGRPVEHRLGQPGGGQPAGDPSLSGLGHDVDGGAAGEQGEDKGDPLGDQRGWWRRQWW